MTKLNRPVRRETQATSWERSKIRPIIVSIEPPNLLGFRLKGTRRTYYLPIALCQQYALELFAANERRRKLAERKAKKSPRRR